MPGTFTNPETGEERVVGTLEQGMDALNAGFTVGEFTLQDRHGELITVPAEKLPGVIGGARTPTADQLREGEDARERKERYDNIGSQVHHFLERAINGVSLGLYSQALDPATAERFRDRALENPGVGIAGDIAGALASIPFGGAGTAKAAVGAAKGASVAKQAASLLPGPAVSKIAERAGRAVLKTSQGKPGMVRRIGSGITEGVIDGAAGGMHQALTDSVIQDKELTGESVIASMGVGAILGGSVGGALQGTLEGIKGIDNRLLRKGMKKNSKQGPLDIAKAYERSTDASSEAINAAKLKADELEALESDQFQIQLEGIESELREASQDVAGAPLPGLTPQVTEDVTNVGKRLDPDITNPGSRAARQVNESGGGGRELDEFHAEFSERFRRHEISLDPEKDPIRQQARNLLEQAIEKGEDFEVLALAEVRKQSRALRNKIPKLEQLGKVMEDRFKNKSPEELAALEPARMRRYLQDARRYHDLLFELHPSENIAVAKMLGTDSPPSLLQGNSLLQAAEDLGLKGVKDAMPPPGSAAEQGLQAWVEKRAVELVEENSGQQKRIGVVGKIAKSGAQLGTGRAVREAGKQAFGNKWGAFMGGITQGGVSSAVGSIMNRLLGTTGGMLSAVGGVSQKLSEIAGKIQKSSFRRALPIASTQILRDVDLGEPPKSNKRSELFKQRVAEVHELPDDPLEFAAKFDERLRAIDTVDPGTGTAIRDTAYKISQKLKSVAPRLPTNEVGSSHFHYSDSQIREFVNTLRAVQDPTGVFERALNGDASLAEVRAVEEVYPSIFREMQITMMETPGLLDNLSINQRISTGYLMKLPLVNSQTQSFLAGRARRAQTEMAEVEEPQQQARGGSGPRSQFTGLTQSASREITTAQTNLQR